MEAFIETVRNPHLKECLERAITGTVRFGILRMYYWIIPAERERWFQFKQACLQQRISEWLEEHGITTQ